MFLSVELGEHNIISREAVREPQLLKLTSGDLLLTYHIQADSHFAERKCLRSRDGGATWQPEPRRGHREQAIGRDDNGLVLAFDIYTFEREAGTYAGSFFRSEDGGETFNGPHETVVHANCIATKDYPGPGHFPPPHHPKAKFYQPLPGYYHSCAGEPPYRRGPSFWRYMIEHKGRWLAPMQCFFHGDKWNRTILTASEDEGKTWRHVSDVAWFRGVEPAGNFCEPALAATPDGNLLCVMRRGANLPLAQCRSTDDGATWSEPELLPGHGVDPDLHLMSNGVLACTYGRPGLHIMFSVDGCGYSWGYRTKIGEWFSSTYMGIAEVAPEELLLVYDCRTGGDNRAIENCYVGGVRVRAQSRKTPPSA